MKGKFADAYENVTIIQGGRDKARIKNTIRHIVRVDVRAACSISKSVLYKCQPSISERCPRPISPYLGTVLKIGAIVRNWAVQEVLWFQGKRNLCCLKTFISDISDSPMHRSIRFF